MRKKYRSRTEIIASILETTARENAAGITRLMFICFLSYPQIKSYLEILMKDQLLRRNDQDKVYRITVKGRQFLDLYSKMADMLKPLESADFSTV
jgi:predicted transcriptional regulator